MKNWRVVKYLDESILLKEVTYDEIGDLLAKLKSVLINLNEKKI